MQQWQDFLQQQGFELLPAGGIKHANGSDGADAYITDLSNYGSLTLDGPDATKFLQGQITCQVENMQNGEAVLGAYCSPKGSVIANFNLCMQADKVMLHMAADVVDTVQAALAKYIVFSKAKLHNENQNWVRIGVWGPQAVEVLNQFSQAPTAETEISTFEQGFILCTNAASKRYVIYCQPEAAIDMWLTLADHARPASTAAWEIEQIKDGLLYVGQEISEHYVPQMLNLQETGAINFQKGCYTGQEVVARMQYLGKLKRHLYLGRINSSTPLTVGMQIDSENRGNIGRITSLAANGDNSYWFTGVINIREAENDTLCIGGVEDSSIEIDPLPYDIDPQVFERVTL